MMTGRITYRTGFGHLGQTDAEPVSTALAPLSLNLSQSSLAQNAPAQWGFGEWAVLAGGLFVLYSVMTTTRRGVGAARSTLAARRERLAQQHESYAGIYRIKGKGKKK